MQYTESLVVEHGYVRGEINATMFHLQVRLACPAGTPDCACRVCPSCWCAPNIQGRTGCMTPVAPETNYAFYKEASFGHRMSQGPGESKFSTLLAAKFSVGHVLHKHT